LFAELFIILIIPFKQFFAY